MDINYLEYFTKIVESGSYASVSRKAFISQPGLHKAMRRLEAELGVSLLKQQDHKTVATPAGELIYPMAKKVCSAYHSMSSAIEKYNENQNHTIRFGFCSPAIPKPLMAFILDFIKEHPDIDLSMLPCSDHSVCDMLLSDQLEFAFRIFSAEEDTSQLDSILLGETKWGVVVSSEDPHARSQVIKVEELAGYTLLLPTYKNLWTESIQELFNETSFQAGARTVFVKLIDSMWVSYVRRAKTAFFCEEKKKDRLPMGLRFLQLDGNPLCFLGKLVCKEGKQMSPNESAFWNGAKRIEHSMK